MKTQITSAADTRRYKLQEGAYEWWYFDGSSADGTIDFVIIFYEGNPFSRRYIQHQQNGQPALAEDFPAVSISVYQHNQPIYYSFTEFPKNDAFFGQSSPLAQVGNHRMEAKIENGKLTYSLELKEELPSGDSINAELEFTSPARRNALPTRSFDSMGPHQWHVIQPRAEVNGQIHCVLNQGKTVTINLKGEGYHDHNVGREPLKQQFEHWYWGRFHFKEATLIYYIMGDGQPYNHGWLADRINNTVLETFTEVQPTDFGRNIFGLKTAQKIDLSGEQAQLTIQQSTLLDNGPFYQRFSSEAFLRMPEQDWAEKCTGITEYLCPPRIYNKRFWPLTNMRIRYLEESPHWVQRSGRLYRWTW